MRMRKILMLITSVRVKMLLTYKNVHWKFLKGNRMVSIKVHNGGNYAHARKILMLITSVRVKMQLNL